MSLWLEKSFWVLDFHVTKCVVTVLHFRCTQGGFHQVNHRFFIDNVVVWMPPNLLLVRPSEVTLIFFFKFSWIVSVSSLADDVVLRNITQRSAKEEATIILQTVTDYLTHIWQFKSNSQCSHWTLVVTHRIFRVDLSRGFYFASAW
jgi:hypothetical protein